MGEGASVMLDDRTGRAVNCGIIRRRVAVGER
jgi:hypothetical protein